MRKKRTQNWGPEQKEGGREDRGEQFGGRRSEHTSYHWGEKGLRFSKNK